MLRIPSGSTFAGYRIENVAGEGGMGVVYRATDLALERSVALKVITPALAGDAEFRRRFTTESKVAASLDHPNVIPIYQAGEHEDVMFLVMRYVEGHDLRSLLADHGRLPPERAASITAQIASALDAAHEAGLVHRDVKPANVLVTASDHVYLTDFGLSKRVAPADDPTATGRLLGTLNYVAPEQIRRGAIGPHTDVYALGGVLFQLLTGGVPFPADTEEGKLWAHLSEPPPSASSAREGVPVAFDEVVRRAMSKRPEDRFQSAGDLGGAAMAATIPPVEVLTATVATPTRGPHKRAVLLRALIDPFNLLLLAAMLTAGVLIHIVVLPIALVLYGVAVLRAYLDEDIRLGVVERHSATSSSSGIEAVVGAALQKEALIRDTIEDAERPRPEVTRELDEFESTMRRTAARAQLLQDQLEDVPAETIETRIEQLERDGDPRHARLVATLRRQLSSRRATEEHLRRFYEEMNETLNELDSVRDELGSASGPQVPADDGRVAAEVRDLRREMGKVGEDLADAHKDVAGFDAYLGHEARA